MLFSGRRRIPLLVSKNPVLLWVSLATDFQPIPKNGGAISRGITRQHGSPLSTRNTSRFDHYGRSYARKQQVFSSDQPVDQRNASLGSLCHFAVAEPLPFRQGASWSKSELSLHRSLRESCGHPLHQKAYSGTLSRLKSP